MTTEKRKQLMLKYLQIYPNVQEACLRAGIGRATYYRWRSSDKKFAKETDKLEVNEKSLPIIKKKKKEYMYMNDDFKSEIWEIQAILYFILAQLITTGWIAMVIRVWAGISLISAILLKGKSMNKKKKEKND